LPPQGAYFLLVDISGTGLDDVGFCARVSEHGGVAGVPGSSFFEYPVANLVRFHFSRRTNTLEQAAERIRRIPSIL
jgi:aminotransferase